MKTLIIAVVVLLITMPAFAELTPEEEKALQVYIAIPIFEILNTYIHHRADQCIDKLVKGYSDKRPEAISREEKNQIVNSAEVEFAADVERRRVAEMEAAIEATEAERIASEQKKAEETAAVIAELEARLEIEKDPIKRAILEEKLLELKGA